jgi:hypothetical protein
MEIADIAVIARHRRHRVMSTVFGANNGLKLVTRCTVSFN